MKRTLLKTNPVASNRENSAFQLFFLPKNKKQDIEVIEVDEIDFIEVKNRLEKGESIFITRKRKQELEPILVASEEKVEPWYFTHL
jgi:hypothetical protein